jgi:hypothetical protein
MRKLWLNLIVVEYVGKRRGGEGGSIGRTRRSSWTLKLEILFLPVDEHSILRTLQSISMIKWDAYTSSPKDVAEQDESPSIGCVHVRVRKRDAGIRKIDREWVFLRLLGLKDIVNKSRMGKDHSKPTFLLIFMRTCVASGTSRIQYQTFNMRDVRIRVQLSNGSKTYDE